MIAAMKNNCTTASTISLIAMLLLSVALLMLAACNRGRGSEAPSRSAAGTPEAVSGALHARRSIKADEVEAADLPSEARHALQLIKRCEPFPYAKDGTTFGNREGMLRAKPHGYYQEYTVKTPGARDRGARRIIAGMKGEYYYTDDHYRSFKRIRE
jgi:ribonuclease T1